MGAGYTVVLGDLASVAQAFAKESVDFAKLRTRMSPDAVDGGDEVLNAGIAAVLDLLGAGNAAVSAAMGMHSEKLKNCHDGYQADDSDVVALYNKLITEA
ncbi:MAG: hypothetical protein QOI74_3725 [Micromonosporaceae bacterium]|jgi:hypothetical protein|nr:hypothetical protein [Micromonosporaceae bacterium]MDT5036502.1 hypothetical protein [Micromonosporaceae bacterium]